MSHYVIGIDYHQAVAFAAEQGWRFGDWVAASRNITLRGRIFEGHDEVWVLGGAQQADSFQATMNEIHAMEAISSVPPIWHWLERYDLPRAGEDLEAWLAR